MSLLLRETQHLLITWLYLISGTTETRLCEEVVLVKHGFHLRSSGICIVLMVSIKFSLGCTLCSITRVINYWRDATHSDSKDDYRTSCPKISHRRSRLTHTIKLHRLMKWLTLWKLKVFFFATVSLAVWMLFLLLIDFLFKSRGDRSVLDTEELRASRLRAVSSTERSAREKRQRPHAW